MAGVAVGGKGGGIGTQSPTSAIVNLSILDARYLPITDPVATGTLAADGVSVTAVPGLTMPDQYLGPLYTVGAPPFPGVTRGDSYKDFIQNYYSWTGVGWVGSGSASAPTVNTDPVTIVGQTTATISGEVCANNQATTYQFQVGTDNATFATHLPSSPGSAGSGTTDIAYSANFTGLTGATVYFGRLAATNATGTTFGPVVSFTTMAATPAPSVVDTGPTGLTSNAITLNGTVNPNGFASTWSFHYGLVSGNKNLFAGSGSGSGSTPVADNVTISGLTPNTQYFYALVANNANGTTSSAEGTFKTSSLPSKPTVTAGVALQVTQSGASLNQTINPNGFTTTATLNVGLTAAYGTTIGPSSPLNGNIGIGVTTPVTGLTPDTLYHFAFSATNAQGTVFGPDQTFTTLHQPVPPTNSSPPAISPNGGASGVTLTVANGTWLGDPTIVFTYQWFRGSSVALTGETNQTYVTQDADVGSTIHCAVTATNNVSAATANSASVSITAGTGAPTPLSPPTVA